VGEGELLLAGQNLCRCVWIGYITKEAITMPEWS
jgi:hypothetical protein